MRHGNYLEYAIFTRAIEGGIRYDPIGLKWVNFNFSHGTILDITSVVTLTLSLGSCYDIHPATVS